MTKLSYCILSFNRKDKLATLLTQLNQTRISDSEIIVVDNGSTDGTTDIVSKFNNEHTKFILNRDNTGVSTGWNTLIRASQSPLPFIFNDDYAVASPGWEQLYLDTLPQICGIMSFPRFINAPVGYEVYNNFVMEHGCKYTHNFRLFGIPRVIYDKVGGFDETYLYGFEDTDFNQSAMKLGYPLLEMNLDKVYMVHLRETQNMKDKYELVKEQIHSDNIGKNGQHFYKKFPHGV